MKITDFEKYVHIVHIHPIIEEIPLALKSLKVLEIFNY